MKLKELPYIYIIYDKESGDFYCAATTFEEAQAIIKEDFPKEEDACDKTITTLHIWTEDK